MPADAAPASDATSWASVRHVLERDLQYRTHRLVRGGLAALFADLHPSVHLDGTHVRVATGCGSDVVAPGGRMILMPSVVCDRVLLLAPQPCDVPVLLYPARVDEARICPATPDERDLVGGEILPLLLDLLQPYTLDEVAGRHQVRPQEASAKRAELASTGLLTPCTDSPFRYQPTSLASVLLSPCCERCS